MRKCSWLVMIHLAAATAFAAGNDFRVERYPVSTGAELLTVFGRLPDASGVGSAELPLVSVLRDTLGDTDPENDRLRYVWVLTSARPTVPQQITASLPFFYWRPDLGKNADRNPSPVVDLSAASRNVWTVLAGSMTQAMALDSNGALLRASTRSYRNNLLDHRKVHLIEGLTVL